MPFERPRARRYRFVASIELTDLDSEKQTWGQTSQLSMFGCRVETGKPLPLGTKVRIRIAHSGASFAALGKVVYAGANAGMGIFFTQIEPNHQLVLEKWVDELREAASAN